VRNSLKVVVPCLFLGCSSTSATQGAPDSSVPRPDGGSESGGGDASHPADSGGKDVTTTDTAMPMEAGGGSDATTITGLDGTTYYVSPSGDDANPGTMTKPWQTIQHAGGIVKAGDTVLVMAGTYDGAIFGWDTPPCSGDKYCVVAGTAAHPILFEADPSAVSGSVVIASRNAENPVGFDLEPGCDYVDIVGFTVTNAGTSDMGAGTITKDGIGVSTVKGNKILNNTVDGVSGIGGILVDTATDVVVAGNTLIHTKGTGTTGHGMYVSGSSVGVQVLGNLIHDNDYVGIHVNGDVSEGLPGVVKGILVSGNVIYDNGQNGINADGLESSTIANNVIYGNARNGIELYQIDAYGGSTANVIVNNTIDQSMIGGSYAISIGACAYDNQSSQPTPADCMTSSADTSTGNIAFDNVLLGGAGTVSDVASDDLSTSTNLTTASSKLFVDAASGNYTLSPGGPGIGTGIATFGGAKAPSPGGGVYDIGAFNFVH
jgi:Right handed beta helix region